MSDNCAIRFVDVSKRYRLFKSPGEMALNLLGLDGIIGRQVQSRPEYPALKGISFSVRRGERVGIIGRNGAGKSTLIRLVTGNATPNEGQIVVNGKIQALLDAGVGFHPDFTGIENIRAALVYNGLTLQQQREAESEIVDFVELGEYINQPLKTYSLGMQARLGFATATAIKPDILLIDEILGAGDAYFASKSADRMKALTGDGVTLLLVSHSTQQVVQFCERTLWLDQGQIVQDGESLEVVKAYEAFIRKLDEKRLEAENRTNLSKRRETGTPRIAPPESPAPVPGETDADAAATSTSMPDAGSRAADHTDPADSDSKARDVLDPARNASAVRGARSVSRWDGTAELALLGMSMFDSHGEPTWHFKIGEPLTFEVSFECRKSGDYACTFEIYVYTLDSRALSLHVSEEIRIAMVAGETGKIRLHYGETLYGNGDYVVTLALHKVLDLVHVERCQRYDLLDRSFQFRVYGNPPANASMFRHPAQWSDVEISPAQPRKAER